MTKSRTFLITEMLTLRGRGRATLGPRRATLALSRRLYHCRYVHIQVYLIESYNNII